MKNNKYYNMTVFVKHYFFCSTQLESQGQGPHNMVKWYLQSTAYMQVYMYNVYEFKKLSFMFTHINSNWQS